MALADMTTEEIKAEIARKERKIEANRRVMRVREARIKEIDEELRFSRGLRRRCHAIEASP